MTNTLSPDISLTPIDPRMRYFWALQSFAVLLLPLLALVPLSTKMMLSWWPPLIYLLLAALLAFGYAQAAIKRFGFALLDDGLWLESGVYWRKASFVPRERVQHTEVSHGPMDRKMGLAKLVLHTAGVRLPQLTIPGLTEAQAHQLRDALLQRNVPAPGAQDQPAP